MQYVPPIGGASNDSYIDGNPSIGIEGSAVPAAAIEHPQREILAVLSAAGVTASNSDLGQLAKAILKIVQTSQSLVATATGTANAITATFSPAIATLTNGMTVMVRAAAANTGAVTFTPAPGVLTGVEVVKGSNAALVAGDVAGAGHWLEMQYDTALTKWVLLNPAKGVNVSTTDATKQPLDATLTELAALVTSADKMIYATGADTFALTTLTAFARTLLDDPDAATALTTLGVVGGATYSMGASGNIKFPSWLGGLIIQWTKTAVIGANSSVTVSFPTTFPGSVFAVFCTPDSPSAGEASAIGCVSSTTSSAVINNGNTENNEGAYILAFGN